MISLLKIILYLELKDISTFVSGGVRGGSGGSADPPKILEPIEKKLKIEHPDPPRSKTMQSDPSL